MRDGPQPVWLTRGRRWLGLAGRGLLRVLVADWSPPPKQEAPSWLVPKLVVPATALVTFCAVLLVLLDLFRTHTEDAWPLAAVSALLVLLGLLRRSWARPAVTIAATVVVVLWAAVPVVSYPGLDSRAPAIWLLAALAATPVPFIAQRPLAAWRLLAVALPLTPLSGALSPYYWRDPWTPGLAMSAVAVLFSVAVRYELSTQLWVWLLTSTLASTWVEWTGVRLVVAVLIGAVMLLGNTVRLWRVAVASQRAQARVTAEERTRRAVLEERARIARELHDVVAHHMTVVALRADSAPYRLSDLPDPARAEFAELNSLTREGLGEMRRLLGLLRAEGEAASTAPQPGVAQVEELVHRLRQAGTPITMSIHLGQTPLPAAVGLTAYRIVQEALSNAVKHAPGALVLVELRVEQGELLIRVHNGAPAAPTSANPAPPGHGLIGMRERVSTLGGTLRTEGPTPEGGFTVQASLPVNASAEAGQDGRAGADQIG